MSTISGRRRISSSNKLSSSKYLGNTRHPLISRSTKRASIPFKCKLSTRQPLDSSSLTNLSKRQTLLIDHKIEVRDKSYSTVRISRKLKVRETVMMERLFSHIL